MAGSGTLRTTQAGVRIAVLALLWGSTYLWIDLALDGLGPVQVAFIRCVFGALTLALYCLWSRVRLPRGAGVWRHVCVAAFFCNALPFTLFSLGQQSVDSGLAGVLNATTPLWSLLLGLTLGTERGLRPIRLAGLLLGFAGTVLIFAPWGADGATSWGALAILGAGASYAIAFNYMHRHLVGKGYATLSLSTAQLLAATGWTALLLPFSGSGSPGSEFLSLGHFDPGVKPLLAVIVLGVLATGVTFHLTYRIIADEGATDAATVGYLLPVVSVLLGALVLGEDLSLRIFAGMAVVLAGVAMTRRGKPSAEPGSVGEPGSAGEPESVGKPEPAGEPDPVGRPESVGESGAPGGDSPEGETGRGDLTSPTPRA
ncbi:EamA family transporter [Streptomyces physcomitrii]|uniref:EamA family transporter n=1 Tax=Streptomyces physcomitrii TaxID=2724184 RepID=UPI0034138DAA